MSLMTKLDYDSIIRVLIYYYYYILNKKNDQTHVTIADFGVRALVSLGNAHQSFKVQIYCFV
jgi:hypothetical protein